MAAQARGQRILLALSSHGLGHLTRSLAVVRELRRLHRDVSLVVATTVPEACVARELPPPFGYRAIGYEPGMAQRNTFESDLEGTRAAYREFLAERDERLCGEKRFLREAGCTAVISDIPALPVRAASALGLPAIGLANFTWDWILEPLFEGSGGDPVPEILASDYARGSAHLRLPFGPETSPFPHSEPAPLVSRRATLEAEQLRLRLGLPEEDGALAVVCPGGWDPDVQNPIHVPDCAGFRFVTVGDFPVTADAPLHAVAHDLPAGVSFPDLVAAADVLLAKPGYGIASECVAHRTALVTIERPGFRETPLLLSQLRRLGPGAQISLADLFAGSWETALRAALTCDTPWAPIPADGAQRVARRLGELLGLEAADPISAAPGETR
jgi:L-arabinokinase